VTLVELLVVIAIIIMLAAVTFPTLKGLKGNSDQKLAVDQVRSRVADARGLAMQEGVPYRLAITSDGTKLRVAPDNSTFSSAGASDVATGGAKAIETKFEKVKVNVAADPDTGETPAAAEDGWITLGVFLPNGTCRIDSRADGTTPDTNLVEVHETGFPAVRIVIRGLTGTAHVLPVENGTGTQGKTK
jgi:type II secretory pathway pseudopilin PulG